MSSVESGNLFATMAARAADEQFTTLLATDRLRLERIVSHGHTTPDPRTRVRRLGDTEVVWVRGARVVELRR